MNIFHLYQIVVSHLPSGVDAHVVIAWIQAHLKEVLGWLRTLDSYEDVLKQILAHLGVR